MLDIFLNENQQSEDKNNWNDQFHIYSKMIINWSEKKKKKNAEKEC